MDTKKLAEGHLEVAVQAIKMYLTPGLSSKAKARLIKVSLDNSKEAIRLLSLN